MNYDAQTCRGELLALLTADNADQQLRELIESLNSIGFADDDPVSGADTVDLIAAQLPALRVALETSTAARDRARLFLETHR